MDQKPSQLTLFNDDVSDDSELDELPLPLIVADRWDFPLRHIYRSETFLYVIRDWVAGLTQAEDPKRAWQSAKKLPEMAAALERIRNVRMPGTAGSLTQMTDDRGLFLIATNLRSTKNKDSLAEIKNFLAKAGVFADLARRDPEQAELILHQRRQKKYVAKGKDTQWIALRELGIITRKQLMNVVYDLLGVKDNLGIITNDTYRGVFGMTAEQLREHIGIPSSAVVRDHFSTLGLVYTQAAEEACRIQLEKYDEDDVVEVNDVRGLVMTLSRLAGKQAKEMSEMLGIDPVTGRKLQLGQ